MEGKVVRSIPIETQIAQHKWVRRRRPGAYNQSNSSDRKPGRPDRELAAQCHYSTYVAEIIEEDEETVDASGPDKKTIDTTRSDKEAIDTSSPFTRSRHQHANVDARAPDISAPSPSSIPGASMPLPASGARSLSATGSRTAAPEVPVTVRWTPPLSPSSAPDRSVSSSRDSPINSFPPGPTTFLDRTSTSLPFGTRALETRSLLSTRPGVSRTIPMVVPPPVASPTTDTNTTSTMACECDEEAIVVMYCGYCSVVTSCSRTQQRTSSISPSLVVLILSVD
ncbi:hypothetical protein BU23DRAFT_594414 [Bimuria novae-zelandiae CBS 107.79]|uniref:Uncharacterized protein n=1 Tax=Bimuria novae-zelandiae CBS 107.79 TaxID=1447943 RepID=A0A6A5VT30_9PLEO|nr:hypothetical protein BU23DRAFT_594414 [Bimuria novae-zelandiae CBS 107.79]